MKSIDVPSERQIGERARELWSEQRERIRQAVLDEAARLFSRNGCGAVGLPAVVDGPG
ncbi:hypothetical protein [Pseudonocardia alni]|uniref:hypothetical protein n=1 Tax=Pseudonocardia alni TaxID=33907 RepID=UPI0027A606E1|nr:hypothetical protein PaSha_05625 [Pseudonocardia alni]